MKEIKNEKANSKPEQKDINKQKKDKKTALTKRASKEMEDVNIEMIKRFIFDTSENSL